MKKLNPLSRMFRVLVSLAVMLPLGPGGLCCCVVQGGHASATVAPVHAAAPGSPCCTPTESEAPVRRPESSDPDECACPQRENAVLASGSADAALTAPLADAGAVVLADWSAAPLVDVSRSRFRADCPAPIPKVPLYRALAVRLC